MADRKNFKDDEVFRRFNFLHDMVKAIIDDSVSWFERRGFVMVVTETVSTYEEDKRLGRVSSSHLEGRAFDIRTRTIPYSVLKEYIKYLNDNYGKLGAISHQSRKVTLVVDKSQGKNPHLHIQLNTIYSKKIDLEKSFIS